MGGGQRAGRLGLGPTGQLASGLRAGGSGAQGALAPLGLRSGLSGGSLWGRRLRLGSCLAGLGGPWAWRGREA